MNVKSILMSIFLIGAFCPYSFSSVGNAPKSFAKWLGNQIDSIYESSYFEDFEQTEKALHHIAKRAGDSALWHIQIEAFLNMHYCALHHGKADATIRYLESVRKLYDDMKWKMPAHLQRKYEQKVRYANANAAYTFGEYENAIQSFIKILSSDSLEPVFHFKCLSYLGHAYSNVENYHQSIRHHRQAFELLPSNKKYDHYRGLSFSYLGIAYKKIFEVEHDEKALKKALSSYLKANDFFSRSASKNKRGEINCYLLLSEMYDELDLPDSAVHYLEKAQALDPENIETLRFWGIHLGKVGAYELSRIHFKESNSVIKQKKGPNHFLIGRNLMGIGKQYEAERRWEEAVEAYQEAFRYLSAHSLHENHFSAQPSLHNIISPKDFFECLKLKACALHSWSNDAFLSSPEQALIRLKHSVETYELAIQLMDWQRSMFESSKYKHLVAAKGLTVYEKAIHACYDAVNKGLDSTYYTQMAFHFMEKNKNRQLRDAMRISEKMEYIDVPDSLLKKETDLQQKLWYYNRRLIKQKQLANHIVDTQQLLTLEKEVFDLTNEWEAYNQQLFEVYPQFYELKYGEPELAMTTIQQRVPKGTLLLEYFYGDESVYLMAISNKQTALHKLTTISTIDSLLAKTLNNIKHPLHGQLTPASLLADLHAMKTCLLPQDLNLHAADFDKLIVIPDGPIGYLPFDMLVSNFNDETDETSIAYLIEDYMLSYAYSSYLIGRQSFPQIPDVNYLGFAPSYSPSHTNELVSNTRKSSANLYGYLMHNKNEVLNAQAIFSGNAFLGTESTEEQFRKWGSEAGILHFSMHAVIDDENPELSKLLFHQSTLLPDSSEIDGSLYLYELYEKRLQAQLAVLSACNTGDGELKRGEGIASLGRAFRYAGCNSIVMSLWEANDKHSQFLMTHFFHHLHKGLTKDEALRNAKLDFLNDPAHKYFNHPFYWASFVLIGEPSKLYLNRDNDVLTISLSTAVLLLMIAFYFRNRLAPVWKGF